MEARNDDGVKAAAGVPINRSINHNQLILNDESGTQHEEVVVVARRTAQPVY
jgi:hypothetical protein